MEQNLNTAHKDFFSALASKPALLNAAHEQQLQLLADLYPQSGILHAMLACASQTTNADEFQQKLKTAAVYAPDRAVLYNLINYPEKLVNPGEESALTAYPIDDEITEHANIEEIAALPDTDEPVNYYTENEEVIQPVEVDDEGFNEITAIEDIEFEPVQDYKPAVEQVTEPEDNIKPETAVVALINPVVEPEEVPFSESYDGNNLEDIIFAQYAWAKDADIDSDDTTVTIQPPAGEKKTISQIETGYSVSKNSFAERLTASEDAEKKNDTEVKASDTGLVNDTNGADLALSFQDNDNAQVSKYDDERLPYSFLWWLDKTRKEHAGTHQPYVPFKPVTHEITRTDVPNELQQQYYENIFHLTTVEELDKNVIKPAIVEPKRKEDEIIERFIQEDPQIKPPSNEKLDNENKARKSAEDGGELVSETLARIYLDQMLYHKAISTYQKLLLKFPEKSSYFAAQIKLLEKKIN